METWIRNQIEETKKRIAEVEREREEKEKDGLVVSEAVLRGYLLGLKNKLETLENALFALEQQQKYSDINHLFKEELA
jgi:hypothetical protein